MEIRGIRGPRRGLIYLSLVERSHLDNW